MAEESVEVFSGNRNPTVMAEIVEIIVRNLSWKHLNTAAQVSRLWRDTAKKLRQSRRYCTAYHSPLGSTCSTFFESLLEFIEERRIKPKGALVFTSNLPSSGVAFLKTFASKVRRHLPRDCPLVGCSGLGVIGTNTDPEEKPTGSDAVCSREEEICENLSLLLLPSCENLEVEGFHIPLRNKYKNISGMKSFLPNTTLPVRLVVVLAHPLSLGKLSRFTLSVREKYGDEVVIVGGYSDSFLFYNSEVTHREIVGLVMAGNIRVSSVLIHGHDKEASWECLYESLERLSLPSNAPNERSFGLMFSCFTRGTNMYAYKNVECSAFNQRFPRTPLVGFFGTGAFGCDSVKLKAKGRRPGGRDFLHTDATVFCLCSIHK